MALHTVRSVAATPKLTHPIDWHPAGWTGNGRVLRVGRRRGEFGPVAVLVLGIVPEPVLTRFERPDDRMAACRANESSQQPMWPQAAQRRRCTHQPPSASHSTQPVPLGGTVGSTEAVMKASLPATNQRTNKTYAQHDSIKLSETKCVGAASEFPQLTASFARAPKAP